MTSPSYPVIPVYTPFIPTWQALTFSTFAPIGAVFFTNPIDTVKVRLQLQNRMKVQVYRNSFDCVAKMLKNEGVRGLQQGLTPAIFREGSKNIFRIGLFDPIMNFLHDSRKEKTRPPFWARIVASATSGALGALSCNPFELIKTRLQAQTRGNLQPAVGYQHNYSGMWSAFRDILKKNGPVGLFKGSGVNVIRGIFGTSANLSTYSYLRDYTMDNKILPDSSLTDILCSSLSSFVTAILMNPVDVIRTRLYNQPSSASPLSENLGTLSKDYYKGGMDALVKVVRQEGVFALYKGFTMNLLRLAPHFTLTFLFLEQMRRMSLSYSRQTYEKDFDATSRELFSIYNTTIAFPNTFDKATLLVLLHSSAPHASKERIERILEGQPFSDTDTFQFSHFSAIVRLIEPPP